ncbi:MAG: acyl-CoA thioesterase [Polyangiaceae bacterium]
MPNLVDIPEHAVSRYPLRVRFCETDLMAIVHHANYLVYFEAARVEYLRRRGVSYAQWAEREGVHLPVISAHLDYKRTAHFDDELVVEARVSLVTRVKVGFGYRILHGEELVCSGETVLACVDDTHRPRRLPPNVLEVLLAPESHPQA